MENEAIVVATVAAAGCTFGQHTKVMGGHFTIRSADVGAD
jgi:hypothetical protein